MKKQDKDRIKSGFVITMKQMICDKRLKKNEDKTTPDSGNETSKEKEYK